MLRIESCCPLYVAFLSLLPLRVKFHYSVPRYLHRAEAALKAPRQIPEAEAVQPHLGSGESKKPPKGPNSHAGLMGLRWRPYNLCGFSLQVRQTRATELQCPCAEQHWFQGRSGSFSARRRCFRPCGSGGTKVRSVGRSPLGRSQSAGPRRRPPRIVAQSRRPTRLSRFSRFLWRPVMRAADLWFSAKTPASPEGVGGASPSSRCHRYPWLQEDQEEASLPAFLVSLLL